MVTAPLSQTVHHISDFRQSWVLRDLLTEKADVDVEEFVAYGDGRI
jgi:hypothetical protein